MCTTHCGWYTNTLFQQSSNYISNLTDMNVDSETKKQTNCKTRSANCQRIVRIFNTKLLMKYFILADVSQVCTEIFFYLFEVYM